MKHNAAGIVNGSDQRRRITPKERDDPNSLLQTRLKPLRLIPLEHQIDPKGPISQGLRLADLTAHLLDITPRESQHPEPSCV
jgi:hypothetical protein